MVDIRELTDILCKGKLTANQLYICLLLREKSIQGIAGTSIILKYLNEVGQFDNEDVDYLIDNDWIIDVSKPRHIEGNRYAKTYEVDCFTVTGKFENLFDDGKDLLFEQLKDEYPSRININNKNVPSKVIRDGMIDLYWKNIQNGSLEIHNVVLEAARMMKKETNGYATMTLENFIKSKEWENIIKESQSSSGDSIKRI